MKQEEVHEASALGGLKNDVTSMQMAGAYSAFGNNGYYTEPHTVKELIFRDGTKINMKPETEVVMSDYTAFIVTDMLKSVVDKPYGTGRAANVPGLHIAGKTGTSNYSAKEKREHKIPGGGVPDIWFVGYNTNYTLSVWTGYEKRHEPLIGSEQQFAKQIFKKVMTHVSEGKETADFTMPNSVQRVKIEKGSAKLAGDYTPSDLVSSEYAVKGNVPNEVSEKYKKVEAPSSLSANYDPTANEIQLSWQHSGDGPFNITMSINGGAEQALPSTSEKSYRMANPTPGATYSFKVIAAVDGRQSDAATASIAIPAPENEEEQIEEPEGNNGNNQGNEGNNGNNENPNNGQNNGNNPNNGKPDANRDDDDEVDEKEKEKEKEKRINRNNSSNNKKM